jgi:hypothetical protein
MKCEICNSNDWKEVYKGRIRDGVFGSYLEKSKVYECPFCKVQRLEEKYCLDYYYYETGEYKKKLQQDLNLRETVKIHDLEHIYTMDVISPLSIRNKNVDVGCGTGALLDRMKGFSDNCYGVEPTNQYRNALSDNIYIITTGALVCIINRLVS